MGKAPGSQPLQGTLRLWYRAPGGSCCQPRLTAHDADAFSPALNVFPHCSLLPMHAHSMAYTVQCTEKSAIPISLSLAEASTTPRLHKLWQAAITTASLPGLS